MSIKKPTTSSCGADFQRGWHGFPAAPAHQGQDLQGSRSGVIQGWMHAGGQAPFPLATMVFSSRECRKSQGMPACCQMGWGAAREPVQAVGTLLIPHFPQGFTDAGWDKSQPAPPAMLRSSFSWMSRLCDLSKHRLTTSLKVFLEMLLCRQAEKRQQPAGLAANGTLLRAPSR